MSILVNRKVKCSVCGTVSEHLEFETWHCFFAHRDLDYRLNDEVNQYEVCPNCGFVAESISRNTRITLEDVRSRDYINCCGIHLSSWTARAFFREFMCYYIDENLVGVFYALLNAAWICDNNAESEPLTARQLKREAAKCRRLAIKVADMILKKYSKKPRKTLFRKRHKKQENNDDEDWKKAFLEEIMVIKADLMRRAGMFDELLKAYENVHFEDETKNIIIAHQKERAKQHYDARIRMDTIIKGRVRTVAPFGFPSV